MDCFELLLKQSSNPRAFPDGKVTQIKETQSYGCTSRLGGFGFDNVVRKTVGIGSWEEMGHRTTIN